MWNFKDPKPDSYHLLRGLGWQAQEIAKLWGWPRGSLSLRVGKWAEDKALLPGEIEKFIECSLLGDGSLVPQGEKVVFSMHMKSRDYVDWVRFRLELFGFKCRNDAPELREDGKTYYYVRTRSSSLLQALRLKWYPFGKKAVPQNFEWSLDALDRLIAEDGTKGEYGGSSVYWGVKDDTSFEKFKEFVSSITPCTEHKPNHTAGRVLYLPRYEARPLPGYAYKVRKGQICRAVEQPGSLSAS